MTCRCLEKAKKHNYKFFGLGFYAECFAGKDVAKYRALMNDPYGESNQCINNEYMLCDPLYDSECVGEANADFVYEIVPDIPPPIYWK